MGMGIDNLDVNIFKIMVAGIGGAGNNAVNRMIEAGVSSAEFIAINTDKQALILSRVKDENKIAIGEKLTKGLGAGSNPEVGMQAAEETKDKIKERLQGVDLLFIAAGMGGGTGTGAAPVVAKIARECGCVTVAVVTKPFMFEGRRREENAKKGIAELSKNVDTIVIIPNDKLLETLPPETSMIEALKYADENLRMGICGIADLISTPSLINLDFADVKTIIQNKGYAHMGVGMASGDNRVVQAVKKAISSPLLETSIEGAKGVILNVKGGTDLTLGQVYEAANLINSVIDSSATVIFGANIDPDYNEKFEITVIATGFSDKAEIVEAKKEEQKENFKNYVNEMYAPERVDVYGDAPGRKPSDAEVTENEKVYASSAAERVDPEVNRVRYEENVQDSQNANMRVNPKTVPEEDDFGGFTVKRETREQSVRHFDAEQPVRRAAEERVTEEPSEPEEDNKEEEDNIPSFMKRLFGKGKK